MVGQAHLPFSIFDAFGLPNPGVTVVDAIYNHGVSRGKPGASPGHDSRYMPFGISPELYQFIQGPYLERKKADPWNWNSELDTRWNNDVFHPGPVEGTKQDRLKHFVLTPTSDPSVSVPMAGGSITLPASTQLGGLVADPVTGARYSPDTAPNLPGLRPLPTSPDNTVYSEDMASMTPIIHGLDAMDTPPDGGIGDAAPPLPGQVEAYTSPYADEALAGTNAMLAGTTALKSGTTPLPGTNASLANNLGELQALAAARGLTLGTNGYLYKPDGQGGWTNVGKVPGFSDVALNEAADHRTFSDPAAYARVVKMVQDQAAPASAGQPGQPSGNSIWDEIVSGAGSLLGHTALGGAVKKLFPDFWYGTGENIKAMGDNFHVGSGASSGPLAETLAPGIDTYSTASPSGAPTPPGGTGPGTGAPNPGFPDVNQNGIDDRLEGRMPVFPSIPPYDPGRDNEWLYFRPNPAYVTGYAEGGPVDSKLLDQQDPRVALIGDTEDAISRVIETGKPSPEDEKILRAFVDKFGDGALRNLFENVKSGMRMRGGKDSGKDGRMVTGPGGPTSDSIPATIDGGQPAALSDGEFVMTADAVRNAGQGDRDLGAQRLQQLNDQLAGLRKEKAA